MINLPDPPPQQPSPHNPAVRDKGRRTLRRWTAIGMAGVLGLTAVSAGLAYEVTSSQESARNAVVDQARAAYQRRLAAENANLATVRGESRALARTLAHAHTLLVARQRARRQALAALAAAQARARAAAASSVYAAASPQSRARQTATQTAVRPVTPPKHGDDGGDTAAAVSGGS